MKDNMTFEQSNYSSKPNKPPINISESVSISVEALSTLGLNVSKDKESLAELLTYSYTSLVEDQDRPGEPFVQLQIDNDYRLRAMLEKIDGREYYGEKYPRFSNWHRTQWTHSHRDLKHTLMNFGHHHHNEDDANLKDLTINARLALSDGDSHIEPLIHFSNKPFDKESMNIDGNDSDTQLEAFSKEKIEYELNNPEFNMITMDVASYAMLTLQRRIKGGNFHNIMGTMIIPDLGRKMILGGSAVSIVHTGSSGKLGLGWIRGNSSTGSGFGISIGHK